MKTLKINWRQIIFHLFGMLFLMGSLFMFAFVYNHDMIDFFSALENQNYDTNIPSEKEILYYQNFISISRFIGLIVGFIISLIVSIKNQWNWVNSIISLGIILILFFLNLFEILFYFIKLFTFIIGKLNFPLIEYSISGILLLTISFFFLLSKVSKRFIEKNNS